MIFIEFIYTRLSLQLPSRALSSCQSSPMVSKPFAVLTAFLFTIGTFSTSFAFPGLQVPNRALLRRQGVEDSTSQAGGGSTQQGVDPPPPPGPPSFTGTKLVNDPDHPWQPLRPGDIRGPCPGLNTLASHGVGSSHYDCILPRVIDNTCKVSPSRRSRHACPDHPSDSRRYFNEIKET